jgi:type I site-specific restriction-modification system R (restriction) subunit
MIMTFHSSFVRPFLLISVQGLTKAVKNGLTNDEWNVIIMDEAHRSASGEGIGMQSFPKNIMC